MPHEDDIPAKSAEDDASAAAKPQKRRLRGAASSTGSANADDAKPIKRSHIAINVASQILLALAIFGIINYLNFRHHKRWDLTENKKYTISDETAGYLSTLDKEVRITMAFLENSKIHQNLKALLEEYRKESKGKIRLVVFDPVRDRNRATEISQRYKLLLESSTVIIDVDGRVKTITEDDMIDSEGRLFRGEDALTSALISATEGGLKKVYLVSGHGQMRKLNGRTALDELWDLSGNQFFSVEPLSLASVQEIPEDADALFILGASLDFSEREIEMMRKYWEGDNGALYAMLTPEGAQIRTPNLRKFFAGYGVELLPDRVLDANGAGIKNFDVQATFRTGSVINKSLAGSNTTFFGQTSSLRILKDNEKLALQGLGIVALVEANSRFWGEMDYTGERPVLDPSDNAAPVFIGASIEKGATEDLRLKLATSRMVVLGNTSLLDGDYLTASNVNFILSGLNWILDRENLINIPAKTATAYRIEITESQHTRMFRLAIFVLPGVVFALGLMVWSIRRA